MNKPGALPAAWRDRADDLELYAAAVQAAVLRRCADELEEALRAAADEALTLAQAAEASGYSRRRLRELVAEGTVPNAGRKGAPRIRRGDLPVRPGATSSSSPAPAGYELDADADALAGRLG